MKKRGIPRLLELAGQKKAKLFVSGVFATISSLMALVPYIAIYLVIIKLLEPSFSQKEYDYIFKLTLIAALTVIVRFGFQFFSTVISHMAAFEILYGLRSNLSKHLGNLFLGYFNQQNTGKIKKILSDDVEMIEHFIAHHIPDMISSLMLPLVAMVFLFCIDWRMGLISIVPLPFALFIQFKSRKMVSNDNLMKKYHDAMEEMHGTIIEYVQGMPVIKIFNQTVQSFSRFQKSVYHFRDFSDSWVIKMAPSMAAFNVITGSCLLFILPFGILFYLNGTLALPALLLFIFLGSGYLVPLMRLSSMVSYLVQISEGVNRIDQIFSQTRIRSPEKPISPLHNGIEFIHVDFSYHQQKVIDDVSFKIQPGSVVALVGPSGAGKTTVANLISRMWETSKGKILIGDTDIRNMAYKDLMDNIGLVFQDVFIFSDTVHENIRMGMENVSRDDVVNAAKKARCHTFIEKLPQGYDTVIGDGGLVHLSGGEKQRISIARILLKDPRIIILDEATAYSDSENELKIQQALGKIIDGKTVVVIAHKLSTITRVDQIIVMKDGRIIEKGTHDDLLGNKDVYWKMWENQLAAKGWALNS